jgi:hypothetical protein
MTLKKDEGRGEAGLLRDAADPVYLTVDDRIVIRDRQPRSRELHQRATGEPHRPSQRLQLLVGRVSARNGGAIE